ncbi:hypothetical protein ECP03047778_2161 [Escherichia coli P0304777.8]|nr:hypothetical protein ECP03047778_2161 [Escherichia coli P0304777.8]
MPVSGRSGRSEKQQFVHVVLMRGVNDVALNHHVLVDEIRRIVLLATMPPTFAAAR